MEIERLSLLRKTSFLWKEGDREAVEVGRAKGSLRDKVPGIIRPSGTFFKEEGLSGMASPFFIRASGSANPRPSGPPPSRGRVLKRKGFALFKTRGAF